MYIAALNLLFIICSIPVMTIGASCTAMYTVLFRFVRNDEPDILKILFKALRDNLKKTFVSGVQYNILTCFARQFLQIREVLKNAENEMDMAAGMDSRG